MNYIATDENNNLDIIGMCSLILPLKILCHTKGKTEASVRIKAGLVKTVRQLIPMQNNLTVSEKEQLNELLPQLEKNEPELVEEIKKLL